MKVTADILAGVASAWHQPARLLPRLEWCLHKQWVLNLVLRATVAT